MAAAAGTPRLAALAHAFSSALAGQPLAELPDCDGVGARIVFGTTPDAFEYLSGATQPYPFIVGPEDVQSLLRLSSHAEIMDFIGFEVEWVRGKIAEGNEFRAILFDVESVVQGGGQGLISPTWDNLLELVHSESAAAAAKLRPHLPALKQTPYPDLLVQIGYDVEKEMAPEEKAKVGTFEAYGEHGDDSLGHARAFLRHTLKCTALFAGDGYTRTDGGERGTREYLVKRLPVSALPGAQIVELRP